jgi:hypothetical protein
MAQIATPATRASQIMNDGRCSAADREAAAVPNPSCLVANEERCRIRLSHVSSGWTAGRLAKKKIERNGIVNLFTRPRARATPPGERPGTLGWQFRQKRKCRQGRQRRPRDPPERSGGRAAARRWRRPNSCMAASSMRPPIFFSSAATARPASRRSLPVPASAN